MSITDILKRISSTGELKLDYKGIKIIFTAIEGIEELQLRVTAIVDNKIVNYRDFSVQADTIGIAIQIAGCIDFQSVADSLSVEQIVEDITTLILNDNIPELNVKSTRNLRLADILADKLCIDKSNGLIVKASQNTVTINGVCIQNMERWTYCQQSVDRVLSDPEEVAILDSICNSKETLNYYIIYTAQNFINSTYDLTTRSINEVVVVADGELVYIDTTSSTYRLDIYTGNVSIHQYNKFKPIAGNTIKRNDIRLSIIRGLLYRAGLI